MSNDISYHAKDILFKTLSEMYKDKSLDFFNLKLPKIKEMLPNNFPTIKVDEKRADNIFRLEDDSILLLEYESNSRIKENMLKYTDYITKILNKIYKEENKLVNIRLVVIYVSDITEAQTEFNLASLKLSIDAVFMKDYNGTDIYRKLKAKLDKNIELVDKDLMNCMLLPLMRNNKEKQEVIKDSIELAKEIKDEKKQYFTIAGLLTATNSIIDENYAVEIRRWLKMTMVEKIYEKEKVNAINKANKEKDIATAKKLLAKDIDIVDIMEITGLTAEEIEKLK